MPATEVAAENRPDIVAISRGAIQEQGQARDSQQAAQPIAIAGSSSSSSAAKSASSNGDHYTKLGHLFADVLDRGYEIYHGHNGRSTADPVVITGAALGLPGTEHIFDDGNVGRILHGEQLIDSIPARFRQAMLDKHITRLVKSENGEATFETISSVADVIKLAGRGGAFDLENEFGISPDRVGALDRVTQLAMAAGIDALRDAGIPLVMRYKTTTKGTQLPDRWGLPDSLRDDTGVIFGSAFPGLDSLADEMARYYGDHERREQLATLETLLGRAVEGNGHSTLVHELNRRIEELRATIDKEPYVFNRRFLLRTLSMGHSQFAEFIGARGPNTQINSACATTTQALSLAEDWIHAGRCRRVIVISADDVTSDHLIDWMGAGFLASGAAATDEAVADAAIPFDRRRHGLIIGMGAAALVVESAEAARERGIQPICEVLSSVTANSAFHGTRLDVQHIGQVMETLIAKAEARGLSRQQIAPQTLFVSHETYTPARGGSASAEIHALRRVFGEVADRIVIANTKGFTGHAMATGIEDVVAVKALETGCVPPVANFKEVDPELGQLNLSKGGAYPVEYAIHLGAGFGSQISMTLLHWIKTKNGVRPSVNALGYAYRISDKTVWNAWLSSIAGRPGNDLEVGDLEVVHHTLRVRDQAGASRVSEAAQLSRTATATATTAVPDTRAVAEQAAKAQIAVPSPSAPPKSAAASDPVREKVLALVAEKTGYPVDMLDLDLDLEADLGVDTVKQAEVFAAIRESYNIARDENRKLRDYPTLAHVIRFVYEKRPDLDAAPVEKQGVAVTAPESAVVVEQHAAKPAPAQTAGDAVKERILALVVDKTGYPKDMLDLDLDLEADLGVDTVKQAEMFAAIREIYSIPRDENRKLRDYPTLAHVIRFVFEKRPDLAEAPATKSSPVISEPTAPPRAAVAAQSATDDPIKEKVLEIVAEKTGYPKDMLDLDLDLEADLGVDTVKQAEMFAAIRAAYHIPRDENLKLRDFPTLAHVIKFAHDRQPASLEVPAAVPDTTPTATTRPIPSSFEAANRIPRRVPVPSLRPPLDLCKATGVVLGSGRRVVVMSDKSGVGDALAKRLKALDVEVLRIKHGMETDTLTNLLKNWLAAGTVHGVYWLPALDDEGDLRKLDFASWHEGLQVRVKSLYATMRVLYEQVAAAGTFLVSATRMGGQHGYDEPQQWRRWVARLRASRKLISASGWTHSSRSLTLKTKRKPSEVADILIEETLRDPGAVEIGYKEGLRWTVNLEEQPVADDTGFDRQTERNSNRLLYIFFVFKQPKSALRDMISSNLSRCGRWICIKFRHSVKCAVFCMQEDAKFGCCVRYVTITTIRSVLDGFHCNHPEKS